MRLFLFDLETTGLSPQTDRILEHGYILWDTQYKKPLGMSSAFWFDGSYPTSWPIAEKINGITYDHIKRDGNSPEQLLTWIEKYLTKHEVDYLVAHNGKSFDHPFIKQEVTRAGLQCPRIVNTPLIDTRTDLPFNPTPRSRHLGHLAYDYGVVHDPNEKHSALFDCQLMLGLLKKFDIETVIKNSNSPDVVVRANVSRENKDLAKFNGYSWNPEKVAWLRTIKDYELNTEKERVSKIGFDISVC